MPRALGCILLLALTSAGCLIPAGSPSGCPRSLRHDPETGVPAHATIESEHTEPLDVCYRFGDGDVRRQRVEPGAPPIVLDGVVRAKEPPSFSLWVTNTTYSSAGFASEVQEAWFVVRILGPEHAAIEPWQHRPEGFPDAQEGRAPGQGL